MTAAGADLLAYRPDRTPLVPPGGSELHERDMTATFAADVTLAAAQSQLARLNQWLPIDGDPDLPLGRLIDLNSTGPLRLGYGAWRDLLLGCQFTTGPGDLITAGGRTVKNVAGYDLTKFMVGQHGAFGRLVTITTRTYRRPESALIAMFDRRDTDIAPLLPTELRPQWAALTHDTLFCGYLGDRRTIDFYRTAVPALRPSQLDQRDPAADAYHRAVLWADATADDAYRVAVPPAALRALIDSAGLYAYTADPVFGVVVGPLATVEQTQLTDAARSASGTVHFRVAGRLTYAPTPSEHLILAKLKRAFDPDGVLPPLPTA